MRKPYYWAERKTWYFRFRDANGKLRGMPLDGETKKEAYDHWRRILDQANKPSEPASGLTVSEVVSLYSELVASRVDLQQIAASTAVRRGDYLDSFLQAIDNDLHAAELEPYHITDWLNGRKRWNANTRHYAAEAIKSMFQWATDEGRLTANPIAKVSEPRGESRDFVIDNETYDSIVVGASDLKFRRRHVTAFKAYLIALRLTGCRPGEPANVMVEDFDGETWSIKRHKNKRKKKSKKPRVVYLHPCAQTLTKIMAGGRAKGPLFRPHESRPWKYSDLRRRFERLRKRKAIDSKCVLYSFRHTWITNAMMATGDVAAVAEMAGTSIQMIEQHYGHLSQRREFLLDTAKKVAMSQHRG